MCSYTTGAVSYQLHCTYHIYREHYYTAVRAGTNVQPGDKNKTHERRRASDGMIERASERTINLARARGNLLVASGRLRRSPAIAGRSSRRSRVAARRSLGISWRPWAAFVDRPPSPARPPPLLILYCSLFILSCFNPFNFRTALLPFWGQTTWN